jgi:hypothetical protein
MKALAGSCARRRNISYRAIPRFSWAWWARELFPFFPPEDFAPYHANCFENHQSSTAPGVLEFFSLYDFTLWQELGRPPPSWDLPARPAP